MSDDGLAFWLNTRGIELVVRINTNYEASIGSAAGCTDYKKVHGDMIELVLLAFVDDYSYNRLYEVLLAWASKGVLSDIFEPS